MIARRVAVVLWLLGLLFSLAQGLTATLAPSAPQLDSGPAVVGAVESLTDRRLKYDRAHR